MVSPANLNAPGQVVIAGHRGRGGARRRAGQGARAPSASIPLPVSAPFHCALMKPARGAARRPSCARCAVADAARAGRRQRRRRAEARRAPAAIEALVRQVSSPVRWEDVVQRLASEGVTTYVEVGPGTVLSGLVKQDSEGRSRS